MAESGADVQQHRRSEMVRKYGFGTRAKVVREGYNRIVAG
jgi:hypothetical protein